MRGALRARGGSSPGHRQWNGVRTSGESGRGHRLGTWFGGGSVITAYSSLLWFGKRLPRGLELHPGEKYLDRDHEVVEETQLV